MPGVGITIFQTENVGFTTDPCRPQTQYTLPMVPGFSQTTRALRADRGPARVLVGVFALLLVAWGSWMALGEVTLYETSTVARVRADGIARLRVPVGGRVVDRPVRLGDRVQAEAVVQRDAAQRTLSEAERLQASGAVSAAEVASARSELAAREARVAAMQARVDQSSGELSEVARAGSAAAVREQQDDEALAAELAAAEAAVRRAEEARERHRVRSPVAGTVGELPELVPGQLVTENTLVAVVVPDSELVVEARFAPERAAGRLAEGQGSRVRLVGAGGLGARRVTVREVGSEPGEDGLVPVILGFEAPPDGLHHGLVAEVEVEVEVVAPLQVLMRAAGRGE
jgi:multidrug efflux pump subunit AcrA (membrane-fusion protein)